MPPSPSPSPRGILGALGSSNPLAAAEALSDLLSGTSQRLHAKFGNLPLDPTKLLILAMRDQGEMQKQRKRVSYFTEPLVSQTKLAELSRWADVIDATYPDLQARRLPLSQVYARSAASPGRPAFRVLVGDLPLPTMVIAIRGTFSMHDVLTDILLENVDFNGGSAHGGFVESGRSLASQIGAATELFLQSFPQAKVVCVGHSLGAAVATVTAMELQRTGVCPSVRAVGFASPRFISWPAAKHTPSFVTSVVNASDIVARISEQAVLELHARVHGTDWLDASPIPKPVHRFVRSSSTLQKLLEFVQRRQEEQDLEKFVVPGDIVYFFEREQLAGGVTDPIAIHLSPDNEKIRSICLSRFAVRDHLWTSYRALFDSICARFDVPGNVKLAWHFSPGPLDGLESAKWEPLIGAMRKSIVES